MSNFFDLCPPGTKVILSLSLDDYVPKVYKVIRMIKEGITETVELDDLGYCSTELLVSKTGWRGRLVKDKIDLSLLDEEQLDWLE